MSFSVSRKWSPSVDVCNEKVEKIDGDCSDWAFHWVQCNCLSLSWTVYSRKCLIPVIGSWRFHTDVCFCQAVNWKLKPVCSKVWVQKNFFGQEILCFTENMISNTSKNSILKCKLLLCCCGTIIWDLQNEPKHWGLFTKLQTPKPIRAWWNEGAVFDKANCLNCLRDKLTKMLWIEAQCNILQHNSVNKCKYN